MHLVMTETLSNILQALRQNILYMKKYFVQCKVALEARLLQKVLVLTPHSPSLTPLTSLSPFIPSPPSLPSSPLLLPSLHPLSSFPPFIPSPLSWIHSPILKRNLACFPCRSWKHSRPADCYQSCKRFTRSLHNTFARTAL